MIIAALGQPVSQTQGVAWKTLANGNLRTFESIELSHQMQLLIGKTTYDFSSAFSLLEQNGGSLKSVCLWPMAAPDTSQQALNSYVSCLQTLGVDGTDKDTYNADIAYRTADPNVVRYGRYLITGTIYVSATIRSHEANWFVVISVFDTALF